MKKVINKIVVVIVLMFFVFFMYDFSMDNAAEAYYSGRLIYIESAGRNVDICCDKETRVCYLVLDKEFRPFGAVGGICVLVGADGKPLLYQGEIK